MSSIKELLEKVPISTQVQVQGWVKHKRSSKQVTFINLHDGSTFTPLQVVLNADDFSSEQLQQITIGSSLAITGTLVASPGKQPKEVQAYTVTLLGASPQHYPLQPKKHTLAYLRTLQHLRMRTRTFEAVLRIRHELSYALHTFFYKQGFHWVHTPIITSIDAEGAGQMFDVIPRGVGSQSQQPFFGKRVSLTVSGQLAAEAVSMGLGKVYTFGPTFRAENSNTTRHLAEFWMVEPEMAFYDLLATVDLAEACIKYIVDWVCTTCTEELAFLTQHTHQTVKGNDEPDQSLQQMLGQLVQNPFQRMTYSEAIALLQEATQQQPKLFDYPVTTWGGDLQTEHERYLTQHFQGPVVVTDYPKEIKAFYMRQNQDGKTVAAMDLLLPHVGEVIGGSQREERLDKLIEAMKAVDMDRKALDWYLDTRRFGSVPHSGFGLGFERLLLFITGMENIRDVIPFPRTPGQAMC